jgi:hypothetical protein
LGRLRRVVLLTCSLCSSTLSPSTSPPSPRTPSSSAAAGGSATAPLAATKRVFCNCWLAFSGETRLSHDTQKDTAAGYGNTWAWLHGVYLGGHENTGIDPRRIERSVAHTRCRRFPRVIPGMTLDCQSQVP